MKIVVEKWTVWAMIVAASWLWTPPVQAATKAEKAEAARLLNETLRREAREGIDNRRELLRPALEQVPPYQAAYGPSGFAYDVRRRQWLLPGEIQALAGKDKQLAAYRAARAKYPNTEQGQVQLVRWCMKHRLDDQARAHWTKVLTFNPDQQEARRQLGFQKINGTWVSRQEVAEAKAQAREFQASVSRWGEA